MLDQLKVAAVSRVDLVKQGLQLLVRSLVLNLKFDWHRHWDADLLGSVEVAFGNLLQLQRVEGLRSNLFLGVGLVSLNKHLTQGLF